MNRHVVYMAHPLAGDISANIARATRWLGWLRRSWPDTTFIAPWIAAVMAGGDDSDLNQRAHGLIDDCALVERCDALVLVGGRVSSGMAIERAHAAAVIDLTTLGDEPPQKLGEDHLRSGHGAPGARDQLSALSRFACARPCEVRR